jgi:hypothetical protein
MDQRPYQGNEAFDFGLRWPKSAELRREGKGAPLVLADLL